LIPHHYPKLSVASFSHTQHTLFSNITLPYFTFHQTTLTSTTFSCSPPQCPTHPQHTHSTSLSNTFCISISHNTGHFILQHCLDLPYIFPDSPYPPPPAPLFPTLPYAPLQSSPLYSAFPYGQN